MTLPRYVALPVRQAQLRFMLSVLATAMLMPLLSRRKSY